MCAVTVKTWPLAMGSVLGFGSARYAWLPNQVHVSHGCVVVAVLPLTAKATGALFRPFQ